MLNGEDSAGMALFFEGYCFIRKSAAARGKSVQLQLRKSVAGDVVSFNSHDNHYEMLQLQAPYSMF